VFIFIHIIKIDL